MHVLRKSESVLVLDEDTLKKSTGPSKFTRCKSVNERYAVHARSERRW